MKDVCKLKPLKRMQHEETIRQRIEKEDENHNRNNEKIDPTTITCYINIVADRKGFIQC